jgi:hypothetical protein
MAMAKRSARNKARGHSDVHDPDVKIVFAVLAVAMLVGALLTGPSKAPAKLQGPAQANAATSSR